MKLRARFVAEFPGEVSRVDLLACVPAAFRHLLTLRLELYRADALPRRYRAIAERSATKASQDATAALPAGDAVDRLVAAYAAAFGTADAGALLDDLQPYFTASQCVELTLVVALAHALSHVDALHADRRR